MLTEISCGLVTCLLCWAFAEYRRHGKLPLPPGPRRTPLYGSIFRRTEPYQADTFTRIGQDLNSDIVCLVEWGNCTVVLNSFEAVNNVLIKNSNGTSTRPRTWRNFRDWGGLHTSIPHLEYGESWKARRQTFNQVVSPSALVNHHTVQLKVAQEMLLSILNDPENAVFYFYEMMGQLMLTLVYGIPQLPDGESHMGLANRTMRGIFYTFSAEFQIACLLNQIDRFIPLPEWLIPIRKRCRLHREDVESQTYIPFEEAKKQMITDNISPSYMTDMFRQGHVDTAQEVVIRDAAGSLYSGALIATGSLIFTFMMAMAWFPEVQTKAQEELDLLLGHGNLPTFAVCSPSQIPYTWAVIFECMRWRPPVSLGLDHCNDADEEYNGYRIPAGSALVANLKAILYDSEVFSDPRSFRTERFLKSNGQFNPDIFDPRQIIFGYGRRKCPGRDIAFTSLVITIASTLATFNVLYDESKVTGMHRTAAIEAFTSIDIPLQFPYEGISLEPRSQETANAIRAVVHLPENN